MMYDEDCVRRVCGRKIIVYFVDVFESILQ